MLERSIYTAGHTIFVENATDAISVYDAVGRLVCRNATQGASAEIRVNKTGLYIVKVGIEAKRIVVK